MRKLILFLFLSTAAVVSNLPAQQYNTMSVCTYDRHNELKCDNPVRMNITFMLVPTKKGDKFIARVGDETYVFRILKKDVNKNQLDFIESQVLIVEDESEDTYAIIMKPDWVSFTYMEGGVRKVIIHTNN
jgi:hypothetical protein